MAGLLGMWLGLSIYNVVEIVFEILYKYYLKFIKRSFLKYSLIKIKTCLTMFIILLMIVNLRDLFNEFFTGQTITSIKISDHVIIPDISIRELFASNDEPQCEIMFDNFVENYPNIEKIIFNKYEKFKISKIKNYSLLKDYEDFPNSDFKKRFFNEIIIQYGFDYLRKLLYPRLEGIESCTIFYIDQMIYDCKNNFRTSMNFGKSGSFLIDHSFNSSKMYGKNFEKIMIKYHNDKCIWKAFEVSENDNVKYPIFIDKPSEVDIKFQKIVLGKTQSSEDCILLDENPLYFRRDCQNKFIKNLLINKYKFDCWPADRWSSIYLDDLKNLFGNKFCKPDLLLASYFTSQDEELLQRTCPELCENEFVTIEVDRKSSHDNTTVTFNVIPKANSVPTFTYSLSMDYNQFIYDIGGTIGMWIGYSALTLPLFLYNTVMNIGQLSYHAKIITKICH